MQLLRFNTWLKKSLNEQRKSQKIDYSKWSGANQFDWREENELVVQREDLTSTQLSKKMRELDSLLKSHDYYFMFSDDSRSYKRGQDSQDKIEKLAHEIGPDGVKLYRKYLKKNESVEETEKKRTKKQKEEDDEIINAKPKVKQSTEQYMDTRKWFPETKNVKSRGSLNHSEGRNSIPVGVKGISYFPDGGNLYENTPKWVPPKVPNKSYLDKHRERTNRFGKVYK